MESKTGIPVLFFKICVPEPQTGECFDNSKSGYLCFTLFIVLFFIIIITS